MNTLVIIPAFNEALNVPKLVHEIIELGLDYIVINDCSTDNSKEVYTYLHINHLDLPLNLGLASVTQVGFQYAVDHNYQNAVVVDGDGQHLPSHIHLLIDKVNEGYDYVIGSRFLQKTKPWSFRMLGSRILCWAIYFKTGVRVTDPTSGMRAMGKNALEEFSKNLNFIAEPDALCYLLKTSKNVCEVQVDMKDREAGISYFVNPFRSIKFMLNVLISILLIQ